MKRSARCWWMMFDMRSVVSSSVVRMFAIAAPRSCHRGEFFVRFRLLVAYILQKHIRSPQPYAISKRNPRN